MDIIGRDNYGQICCHSLCSQDILLQFVAHISLHVIFPRRGEQAVCDEGFVLAFTWGQIPPYALSLAPEALSWLLLRAHGKGIQMWHEPQSRGPQYCCQLLSSPHFLTVTLLTLEARTVIKDVCTLKCCHVTVTMGSSVPCIPDRNSLSAKTKALLDEVAGRNSFRFISLDAFACSVF